MHEVATAPLIAEIRVGFGAQALCLRLSGVRLTELVAAGDASVALIVAGPEVRVLPIERPWIGDRFDRSKSRSRWIDSGRPPATFNSPSRFAIGSARFSRRFRTGASGRWPFRKPVWRRAAGRPDLP